MATETYISMPIISTAAVRERFEYGLSTWYSMLAVTRQGSATAPKQHSGIFLYGEFVEIAEDLRERLTKRQITSLIEEGERAGLWEQISGEAHDQPRIRMCGVKDVAWRWMEPLSSTGHRFLTGLQERPVEDIRGDRAQVRKAFVRHCAERPVDHARSHELMGKELRLRRETVCRLLKGCNKVANYVIVSQPMVGHESGRQDLHRAVQGDRISYRRRTRRPSWVIEWNAQGRLYVALVTQTVNTYLPTGKPIEMPNWSKRIGNSWWTPGTQYPPNDLARMRKSQISAGEPVSLNQETRILERVTGPRSPVETFQGPTHLSQDGGPIQIVVDR